MTIPSTSLTRPAGRPDLPEGRPDLEGAFFAKVAVYQGSLAAGLGLKALSLEPLRAEVGEPEGRAALKALVVRRIGHALSEAGVSFGVDGETVTGAAEAFVEQVERGNGDLVARKVAQGEPPEPGKAGRLEYLLNPDGLPMHEAENLPAGNDRRWLRMVRKGEALVQLVPPQPGKPGRGVRGEVLEAGRDAKAISLESVMGTNTSRDGNRLTAGCDGECEENASGQVRVLPEVAVEAVDGRTGNLPEAGMSNANILVRRDIRSGFNVSTSETVFVGAGLAGGVVEGKTRVAARDLVVNGILSGTSQDASDGDSERYGMNVQEVCAAQEISGAQVTAGRILVARDSRMGRLEADEAARVDGDLVGGVTVVRQELTVAGNLGSPEGGSQTRVIVPAEGGASRRKKRVAMAVHQQKKRVTELQERLARLEAASAKRARSDRCWAAMMSGQSSPPKNPVEANTQRQYKDMVNEKKEVQRSMKEILLQVRELQEQAAHSTDDGRGPGARIRVGGFLCLDATFEVTTEVSGKALEEKVSYSIEGNRFRNHTLLDVRNHLVKQAGEYMQAQSKQVDDRKQAIEEIYKGAERHFSGPEVAGRRFELPFAWGGGAGEEESGGPFQTTVTAIVDSREPGHLYVRTIACGREAMKGTEVTLLQEGPRVGLKASRVSDGSLRWQDDPEALRALDGIAVQGITARQFLNGAEAPS